MKNNYTVARYSASGRRDGGICPRKRCASYLRRDQPNTLDLSLPPSHGLVKAACLGWPRQQAFSIGPLPGQHRGRAGQREEQRKKESARNKRREAKEKIKAENK